MGRLAHDAIHDRCHKRPRSVVSVPSLSLLARHLVGALLRRLDTPAHTLVWGVTGGAIRLVELPRLNLSFAASLEPPRAVDIARTAAGAATGLSAAAACATGGEVLRLRSLEHHGYFLSDAARADSDAARRLRVLLRGMPHAVVLEDGDGRLKALLPALARPLAPKRLNTDLPLRLARSDAAWHAAAATTTGGAAPFHLYDVHASCAALVAPSLEAVLTLLLLRVAAGEWAAAAALAASTSSDAPHGPEARALWRLVNAALTKGRAARASADASAVRLRISLATRASHPCTACAWEAFTGASAKAPFGGVDGLARELARYAASRELVDAACRLGSADEADLFALLDERERHLHPKLADNPGESSASKLDLGGVTAYGYLPNKACC